MTYRTRSAEDRRREIQENAQRLGINEAFVSNLVDTFYTRVRADPILGPIFANEITGDWGPHLSKMKDFWSSVAMNTGRYSGKPFPVHMKLTGVTPDHFKLWLALFRTTLEDISNSPETVDYFMERAQRIAQSLRLGMFSPLNPANA